MPVTISLIQNYSHKISYLLFSRLCQHNRHKLSANTAFTRLKWKSRKLMQFERRLSCWNICAQLTELGMLLCIYQVRFLIWTTTTLEVTKENQKLICLGPWQTVLWLKILRWALNIISVTFLNMSVYRKHNQNINSHIWIPFGMLIKWLEWVHSGWFGPKIKAFQTCHFLRKVESSHIW